MPKITVNADCDDAPKKQLLRDLNIAYAQADVENVLACLTDDIHWQITGAFAMRGKAEVREVLELRQEVTARELVIHSIITDGAEGAVKGVISARQGETAAFCNFYQFASAAGGLIKSIMSFTIEIKTED
jgi:ketosteroid isomerase-like protein